MSSEDFAVRTGNAGRAFSQDPFVTHDIREINLITFTVQQLGFWTQNGLCELDRSSFEATRWCDKVLADSKVATSRRRGDDFMTHDSIAVTEDDTLIAY